MALIQQGELQVLAQKWSQEQVHQIELPSPANSTIKKHSKRIPRSPNSFIVFRRSIQDVILAENPGINVTGISRIAGQRWKNVSPNEKESFKAKAEMLKKRHQKVYPLYQFQPQKKGGKRSKESRQKSGETHQKKGRRSQLSDNKPRQSQEGLPTKDTFDLSSIRADIDKIADSCQSKKITIKGGLDLSSMDIDTIAGSILSEKQISALGNETDYYTLGAMQTDDQALEEFEFSAMQTVDQMLEGLSAMHNRDQILEYIPDSDNVYDIQKLEELLFLSENEFVFDF